MTITNNLKSNTDSFYWHTFALASAMHQPQLVLLSQEAILLPLIRICAYILSKLLQIKKKRSCEFETDRGTVEAGGKGGNYTNAVLIHGILKNFK